MNKKPTFIVGFLFSDLYNKQRKMNDFYLQFISIAAIHIFAVMSPGPDFAIIVKQSITRGRKAALAASLGIGTGILAHVALCMLGMSMVIAESDFLFNLIKILGASYLIYIGLMSIIHRSDIDTNLSEESSDTLDFESFKIGLLTNVLNPKATLFFLSLYALVITDKTTLQIQALYGLWMAFATTLWFSFLSVALTNKVVLNKIQNIASKVQVGTGLVLIIFAVKLLFSNQ